jgi:hypothetical protein
MIKMVVLLIALITISCSSGDRDSTDQFIIKDPVIKMEDYQVNLRTADGLNELKVSCTICHSLRYIEMQPDFPSSTWETLVNKMRKTFGAPIPDSTADKILHYLVQVKGEK